MTTVDPLEALKDTFADAPLEVRRHAWEWWSALPGEGIDRRCKVARGPYGFAGGDGMCRVCPWGAILYVCADGSGETDRAIRVEGFGLHPQTTLIASYIPILTDGGWKIAQERDDLITTFTAAFDSGLLNLEQIHRLMVPEDFCGGNQHPFG